MDDTRDYRSGMVTRRSGPVIEEPLVDLERPPTFDPAHQRQRQKRTLLLFGGSAAAVALVGVVVLLVTTFGGADSPLRRHSAPADDWPPLAKLCPPPTGLPPTPPPAEQPSPYAGPRTTDTQVGISYRRYDEPWIAWKDTWTAGTLNVSYRVGQHFVTEVYPGGTYHASVLSASVPATVNDALTIDLECTGRQVAADVRAEYYPQPNRMELLRDERASLGGRQAWVTKFRLHFTEQGLQAGSELVAVALIDVGRPDAAILYISIPDTHRQFDWVVDDALASVEAL